MKYIKEYKDIDWEDWDEEEIDPIKDDFLTIDEIIKHKTIYVENRDKIRFAQLLDDNGIKWLSGNKVIEYGDISYILKSYSSFRIASLHNRYALSYSGIKSKINFRKK